MGANDRQVGGNHYQSAYQFWDLAVDLELDYMEGSTACYVARWRKKGGKQDLEKSLHYLEKIMETPKYPRSRIIPRDDIFNKIRRYGFINQLETDELRFIFLVCSATDHKDYEDAKEILDGMIDNHIANA
jgi:hypothetical protein